MMTQSKFGQQLEDLFAIDFRSLAAFRIIIGTLLVARSLFGITGGSAYLPNEPWEWSALGLSQTFPALGSTGSLIIWSALLCAGTCLLIGKWTRAAVPVCWALMFAYVQGMIHTTGPDIGSYLALVALLWMMFLPVNRVAALDGDRLRGQVDQPSRFLSFATAAVLLQPIIVYVSAGITKNHQDWFVRGDAIFDLMHTSYATPFGNWLINFPGLLYVLTVTAIFMEVVIPFFFLWIWKGQPVIRTVLVVVYTFFHLSMAATINLGGIPFACIAFLVLFLPSTTWDFLCRSKSTGPIKTQTDANRIRSGIAATALALVFVSLALSLAWPHDKSRRIADVYASFPKAGLHQGWVMFNSPSNIRKMEEERRAKQNRTE